MSDQITKSEIDKTKEIISDIKAKIDVSKLSSEKDELEILTQDPKFWSNTELATKIQKELTTINETLEMYVLLEKYLRDIDTFSDLLGEQELSANEKNDISKEIIKIIEDVDSLSLTLFLNGPYDESNAVITIKAGQGGTEAQDWTGILYRMYTKYAIKKNWTIEVIDEVLGESGYSTVVFQIIGKFAYGYLKKETGVHRLVRISPFNAQGLRQTSFTSVEVMPVLESIDVNDIEIRPEDIAMDTMKGSGPGGQSVNTTNSAVRITHIPTGIVVKCSSQKSQIQNKETALKLLKSKLYILEQEKKESEKQTLRKDVKRADWGNQIRNYVLHPYKLVKDLRTQVESSNPDSVLDGDLDAFIMAEIKL